jgi:hypothetical protein
MTTPEKKILSELVIELNCFANCFHKYETERNEEQKEAHSFALMAIWRDIANDFNRLIKLNEKTKEMATHAKAKKKAG